MRIFVDAMGGDFAPGATVEGVAEALRVLPELQVTLAGVEKAMRPYLDKEKFKQVEDRVRLVETPEVISNHDSPVMAIRQKKGSGIVMGMLAVREGEADGFVSAGSTGAVLAGGMFRLGRVPGIERPALAPLMPNGKGYFLLIDCGANVDCQPEWLDQFGLMGSVYMQKVMGIDDPRVGLVNIGAEPEKGNALVKAAYPAMERAAYSFVGNVEARDITNDRADVLVCDGFSGNLILKFMEGVAGTLMHIIKKEILSDLRGYVGGFFCKPAFRRVAKLMDYAEVGGAPLLGVQGVVVKAHGSSNSHAMACAIKQATLMAQGRVPELIGRQIRSGVSRA